MKSKLEESIIIENALQILEERLRREPFDFNCIADTEKYLVLKLSEKDNEIFSLILLDSRHRMIDFIELFTGTVDACSVHTREVVRLVLKHNAAAIILTHNHPSGVAEPSQSDIDITDKIRQSLSLIDVRVLDHIVIGGTDTVSFAKRGLV